MFFTQIPPSFLSFRAPKNCPDKKGKPMNTPQALLIRWFSIGKSRSAFCASSFQNLTSVCSAHSLSETMLFLSLTLFRLIRSKHFSYTSLCVRGRMIRTDCYNYKLHYTHKRLPLSSRICFFPQLFYKNGKVWRRRTSPSGNLSWNIYFLWKLY